MTGITSKQYTNPAIEEILLVAGFFAVVGFWVRRFSRHGIKRTQSAASSFCNQAITANTSASRLSAYLSA
jgi:hypothetical protein